MALQMAALPEGDQARQLIGAPSELGARLTTWLGITGSRETGKCIATGSGLHHYDREAAKIEAERPRPGVAMWTAWVVGRADIRL